MSSCGTAPSPAPTPNARRHQRTPTLVVHPQLRKTRSLYRALIRNHQLFLFTWIDPDLTTLDQPLARTTSSLEGGPNRALKDLFRIHRGLPTEHARRAAEWKHNSLTATPAEPWSLVRPEHLHPPRRRPVEQLDDEPRGPVLGTSFSWEDGNGLQHGRASRSRP